jgi:hypothetical protein
VEKEGGMESISQERRWTRVATSMGYESGKGVGGTLKCHYERLLFPYYLFKTGASLEAAVSLLVLFLSFYLFYFIYLFLGINLKLQKKRKVIYVSLCNILVHYIIVL